MKKSLVFVVALILVFALTGCSSSGGGSGDKAEGVQTVSSNESSLTLEFPESWEDADLHELSSVHMAHMVREQYLIVIEEPVIDFADDFTLSDYSSVIMNNMVSAIDTTDSPVITDTKVGSGVAAKQFELSGTVDSIKIKYLVTLAESNGIYYQFTAWSLVSKYDDAKPVFETILGSAKF